MHFRSSGYGSVARSKGKSRQVRSSTSVEWALSILIMRRLNAHLEIAIKIRIVMPIMKEQIL